jgi:hypothetical protein
MTNTMKVYRLPILAVALVLAGLSMLLIPGVPEQVAMVPATAWSTIGQAWTWLVGTFSTVFSWLS